jgi:hypothetical protein
LNGSMALVEVGGIMGKMNQALALQYWTLHLEHLWFSSLGGPMDTKGLLYIPVEIVYGVQGRTIFR